MTITTEATRVEHTGDGATKPFAVPFKFLVKTDLVVVLRTIATGVETAQTLYTDYTVLGAGDASGTVTFVTAPPSTQRVVIYNDPALTQLVDYQSGDTFPAETHEEALDRLTIQQKRTREITTRAILLPDADTDGSGAYDAKSNRISSLGTPTAGADAATKTYVDATVTNTVGPIPDGDTYVTATGSTTARKISDRWAGVVNVLDFGAVGDGVTDDAPAIIAAEASAFAAGALLEFPHATYGVDGGVKLRVSVRGNNSTLLQLDSTLSAGAYVDAWTVTTSSDDGAQDNTLIFDSLRIDGGAPVTELPVGQDAGGDPNLTLGGFGWRLAGVNGVRYINCHSNNVSCQGFFADTSSNVTYEQCESHHVYWWTSSGDSFYTQRATDVRYINCVASSFRRIGFVAEGRSTLGTRWEKSERIHYENCVAYHNVNSDDSTTNWGAGFWIENTLSASYKDCYVYDMNNGIGNASIYTAKGFVAHLVVPADDELAAGALTYSGCVAETVRDGWTMSVSGPSALAQHNITATLEDCIVRTAVGNGFNYFGGFLSYTMRSCAMVDSTAARSILYNGYSYSRTINSTVENFRSVNNTLSDVDIRFWNTGTAVSDYVFRDCQGLSAGSNGAGETLRTLVWEDCHIAVASDATGKLMGALRLTIDGCLFTLMTPPAVGGDNNAIFGASTRVTCSNTTFELQGNELSHVPTAASTDVDISFTGCTFKNTVYFPALADASVSLSGCVFEGFDGTTLNGAMIWTDHYAAANSVLSVTGCVFMSSDATDIPLKKKNQQPTHTILSGNSYNTTAMTDFTNTIATGPYLHLGDNTCLNDGGGMGITALDNTGTPTVAGGSTFTTGGVATVTDFDDGVLGQTITVLSEHAVTITDGTNIILHGSADFDMEVADSLTLVLKADNKWYETARMVNL